jgi:hypothetical protein
MRGQRHYGRPPSRSAYGVPDIAAELSEGSPILRAVAGAAEGRVHSLTVSAKGGRIHKVTLFDEPPEWL